jgi:NADH-quinone oxidoreductase subunit J
MERIIFYILAFMMIACAIASVSSRKMLRSVIYLLFVLTGVAGIFFLIDYNFLAAVELTVYAGGIIVLMIFSVLLVHHIELKLDIAKLLL